MRSDGTSTRPAPRFQYGWVIVAASLVLMIGTFGTQLAFGVFLKPLADEFGWSRASISGAMSLMMGISGIIGVVMGRLSDRYNVRVVIGIGAAIGATAYFLLATTGSLWQFYLYFGVGGGVAVGSTYTPVGATISKWFVKERALAIGIALMGIAVGPMVFSPVSAHLITTVGWRWAYIVLGCVVVVCAIPALVFMGRNAPADATPGSEGGPSSDGAAASDGAAVSGPVAASGPVAPLDRGTPKGRGGSKLPPSPPRAGMTARTAVRTAPFWMLMVTGLVVSGGFYIVAAHIVPAATDVGISTTSAALILTMVSLGSMPGTILGWSIARKIGLKNTLLMLIAAEALGMFLFIFAKSTWAFYVVGALFGFGFGGASPVRQAMVPPLFGLKSVGSILGFAFLAWSAGGVAGPYLAGAIFDLSEDYRIAFVVGGVLLVVGVVAVRFFGDHRAGKRDVEGEVRDSA